MASGDVEDIIPPSYPGESFLYRSLKNTISGTAGGISVCLVGHPFDTLKVRLQTQPVDRPVYKGLVDCFVKTLKWEGIGGLYKGVGSPIVGQMFFRATLFGSYFQEREGQRLTLPEYYACGAGTGLVVAFIEGPIDLFKSKMQVQIIRAQSGAPIQYRNVFHAGYTIAQTYGIRGCYQGLSATLVRNIPANGFFFGFYEFTKNLLTPEGGTVNDVSPLGLLTSGAMGGFFYWFLTYPTDLVKSSMMADHSDKALRKYHGYIDCARKLYTNEGGWRRFYRGFTPCLLRSMPANAAMFLTVETLRKYFP
ncbi:predicted protein [Nematostella vectensis]|uniref:Mitochondrial carrier protein n=1 Tax=Nematostella vectensis TaxID=45351 RepID=A7SDS4_NEMVE|nr:predicted protein [Nematostella vectensis]|eukprot:XP_001630226.1 predicted protein [Nematostella vectensis]